VTGTLVVFVNGASVHAPAGADALDAVRLFDPDAAAQLERRERALTDSRGLPVDVASPLYAGAIFRIVSARGTDPA
jgi:hypothetical protein